MKKFLIILAAAVPFTSFSLKAAPRHADLCGRIVQTDFDYETGKYILSLDTNVRIAVNMYQIEAPILMTATSSSVTLCFAKELDHSGQIEDFELVSMKK